MLDDRMKNGLDNLNGLSLAFHGRPLAFHGRPLALKVGIKCKAHFIGRFSNARLSIC